MRCILYLTLLLLMGYSSIAQSDKFSIKGKVHETESVPVEFATIALYALPDSVLVKGVVADENGYYRVADIKPGNYYLVVTNFGYMKTYTPVISVTREQPHVTHDVMLPVEVTESEGVVVQGSRSLIKQEAGSTVVDIENNTLNAGLSLAEALKRVPGVTVDKDGKVKLKGKEGAMIMLDGKPLYMDAAQIGTLLKSIPADQVKEVEVLTSPSAKYDASGNAGVINIKLKKGAYEGLNGTANAAFGHGVYPKGSAGINLSYKKKNLSVSGGYQYNYKKNMEDYYTSRRYTEYGDSSFNTHSRSRQPEHTHSILLNGSYELSAKGTLLWDGNFMQERGFWDGTSKSLLYSPEAQVLSEFISEDRSRGGGYNLNAGVGYKHKFDTTGTELSVGAEYKTMDRRSTQRLSTFYYDGMGNPVGIPYEYNALIPVALTQWTMKADYTKILPWKIKMETGVKYNRIETNSDISSSLIPSNHFVYTENIPAAYMMLNRKLGKWDLGGGLRAEQTQTRGDQKSIDSTFTRKYLNFFPSASISYHATAKTTYTLLYSKRIQRPHYSDLNPFVYYSDPYNMYAGNPYLLPQYTHHTELTISNWNGVLLSTLNYSYMTQPKAQVWILDQNSLTTIYTTRNLTSQENIGVSFSLNTPVTKWWSMSNYFYLYNNRLTGDVGYGKVVVSRYSWQFNATHTFKLPYGISAELAGFYEAPHYWGTMLYREVWQLSAGVQKKMWREKLSVKLSVNDMFWKHNYIGNGTFGSTEVNDGFKWDNRVVMLSLSYRFGQKVSLQDTSKGGGDEGAGGRKR